MKAKTSIANLSVVHVGRYGEDPKMGAAALSMLPVAFRHLAALLHPLPLVGSELAKGIHMIFSRGMDFWGTTHQKWSVLNSKRT